jgi:rubredoxin
VKPQDANVEQPTTRSGRRECGICWTVYDPKDGDPLAQVPPGTPFEALPENWCCPNCEAPKYKFLVLTDG